MVSFLKRYQSHQIGTPPPSGQSHHHRLPLVVPYPSSSLPPLRVILTHFTLLSYERALRLPTSFPISDLVRLGVKPRLCRWSLRAFASTHPLMLPPSSLRSSSCLPSLSSLESAPVHRGVHPFHALSLSLSLILLSLAKVRLSPPSCLVLWTDAFFPFSKGGSDVANCSFCGTEATLSFSAGLACSSFSAEACAIPHALCWSRQHQQVCHFFSLLSYRTRVLSSPPSFLLSQTLWQIWQGVFSLLLFYQATMASRTLVSPGQRRA